MTRVEESEVPALDQPVFIDRFDEVRIAELAAQAGAGPLAGVRFAVKDNIDVAGVPTTGGCPARTESAAEHAVAVQRLLAAGAVPVGKTNLDQFATGLVGTRSPWAPTRRVAVGSPPRSTASSGSSRPVGSSRPRD